MRKLIQLCLVLFCLAALPLQQISAAVSYNVVPTTTTTSEAASNNQVSINKTALQQNKKAVKKQLKEAKRDVKAGADRTLCAIIAIFIPFLGVGLYMGITTEFWISLILTLLFFIPGLIYALWVILR